jgi:phage terminase large subunit-like protein
LSRRRDPEWPLPATVDDPAYAELLREIENAPEDIGMALFREACLNDFWFFCRHCLTLGQVACADKDVSHYGRPWLEHPWLFARCREIQAAPDGFLDLWPRYHFKTALVTQSLTLWDLIDDPELRVLFITNKLDVTGEGFTSQMLLECESNERLRRHFPDVFYEDPRDQKNGSPMWRDTMFTVKRQLNPQEASVMVCGIYGLVTAKHFDIRVWDDLVVEKSVTSKDEIERTTDAWRKATGLAADDTRDRMVGTRWALHDTYETVLETGAAKIRRHDLYDQDGNPVLRSRRWCEEFLRRMGSYHFAAQMLNNPIAGNAQTFRAEWLLDNIYEDCSEEQRLELSKTLNVYIVIDAAGTRKESSDYSTLAVIGVAPGVPGHHFYLLDFVRDRIGLVDTTRILFELVERWRPLWTFEEQFGAQRDIEHFKYVMREQGRTHFRIRDIKEQTPKAERIVRLQPVFEAGRFHFPRELQGMSDGRRVDLVALFRREEYDVWTPETSAKHDDMLDVLAWMVSPATAKFVRAPQRIAGPATDKPDAYQRAQQERKSSMQSAWTM